VVESNAENYRIRKVRPFDLTQLIVCFYLEDNSISINEDRSRRTQASLRVSSSRREKTVNKNGKFFVPQDFRVGDVVDIHGKSYSPW
jgi:hypothetical protein